MKSKYYLLAALATIVLGLGIRKVGAIPLWIGDSLYAVMIYFGVRTLLTSKSLFTALYIALLYCYMIECLQLVQTPFLMAMRQTMAGKLILGSGFLWGDLLAYTAGAAGAYLSDKYLLYKTWDDRK